MRVLLVEDDTDLAGRIAGSLKTKTSLSMSHAMVKTVSMQA